MVFSRSRYLVFALVLLAVLVGPVLAQSDGRLNRSEFTEKLQLARMYEQTRDLSNAVRVYEQLYAQDSTNEEVFGGLTRSLIGNRDFSQAETLTEARLRFDSSFQVVLQSAEILAMMNERDASLSAFRRAEDQLHATSCVALFPVVYAMTDVSYNRDAIALLDKMRGLESDPDADICSSQIASVYLRLGDYDRASGELVRLVRANENNVVMVEQRLAPYTTDSVSRASVLGSMERSIRAGKSTRGTLRLLAWLYGELKEYDKALDATLRVDNMLDSNRRQRIGYELLQFADRARNEGALDVAVRAYDEAISRLKVAAQTMPGVEYQIGQAELGALETREASLTKTNATASAYSDLVARYETFAAKTPAEFGLQALVKAGMIAFEHLFDLNRATQDFASVVQQAHGFSPPARDASFALVRVAIASGDLAKASEQLTTTEQAINRISSFPGVTNLRMHALYLRGMIAYYSASFDTASSMLQQVAADAESDYSNDAIQLVGLLDESKDPSNRVALQLYAKANFAEQQHHWSAALEAYKSIVETQSQAALADDAALREAKVLVAMGQANEAVRVLDAMQTSMPSSPLLDEAAIRAAEIVETDLGDKRQAQQRYEDFLARFPDSTFLATARDRARKLRGDAF